MGHPVTDEKIRMAAVHMLERDGYTVINTGSGSGVPKFSRIEIVRGDERNSCVIKTTTGGRVSFSRNADGSYKVLSEADIVIHARYFGGSVPKVRVSMFNSSTVLEAFDKNHQAKISKGMEHIPSWVNPEVEEGWRMTGSGFQKDAIWSRDIVMDSEGRGASAEVTSTSPAASAGLVEVSEKRSFMDNIKTMLSEHLGVHRDLIEIDIHLKA